MKRFVLEIFNNGDLDEVIEGLDNINEYLKPILNDPPLEDRSDDFEDMFNKEFEEEEYE
jgi:hypothetical protein